MCRSFSQRFLKVHPGSRVNTLGHKCAITRLHFDKVVAPMMGDLVRNGRVDR